MTRNIRVIGLGLLAAACAFALAQDAITLKTSPKAGDTYKYKLNATMDMSGMSATVKGSIIDKVLEVSPSGEYLVESSQADTRAELNGQEFPIPADSMKTKYTAAGDVLDLQADQVTPEKWRMAQMTKFIYPGNPIKVGDEWTSTVAADTKNGSVAGKATYKFEALEKVGDKDTAKIKVSYTETEGSTPASAEGYTWVDLKDGLPVKSETKWTNAPIGPSGSLINGTVTITRES
ncbi:MAG: hypothetical protein QOJ65_2674 [Fimbriimonadaceae bacterium]|jgi:hypothetical protein|nr:hypothetical protein [Fimbriimonadaceae bacterium]